MPQSRWTMLAVLFAARTVMAWQFQTVGSLGQMLVDAFGIDYARQGTLVGLYMLPGIFLALPGGILGQRFGAKRVVVGALALMTIGGALTGFSSTFAAAAAGRLIAGTGAVLVNVLVTKMVADWFAGRELVGAMSLLVTSWPFGIALALMTCVPLAAATSPAVVFLISAVLAGLCVVLVALVYRDPPHMAPSAARLTIDLTRQEWRLVSLAGVIWATYNVAYILLVNFAPEIFTGRGYSLSEAGALASLLGWLLIPAVPVGGYVAQKSGRPNLVIAGTFAVVATATLALPFAGAAGAMFLVLAVTFGLPGGCIMALPAEVLRPQSRSAGMGVYFSWYYAGMALLPGLAGWARDATDSASAPIILAAALVVAALACLAVFQGLRHAGPARNSSR